jgi:hypothetical protein
MRIIPVITAAAIGLVASLGVANAQATQTSPKPGAAPTVSSSTQVPDPATKSSKKMKKASKKTKSAM